MRKLYFLSFFISLLVFISFYSTAHPTLGHDDWGDNCKDEPCLNTDIKPCDPCNPWTQEWRQNTLPYGSAPRPCDPFELENKLSEKMNGPLTELQNYINEKNIDVNQSLWVGDTILIMAINANRLDIVRWLIARGAHINTSNRNKEAPLYKAVRENNEAILRFLLEQENIAVNQPNGDGITPLMLAVEKNHVHIVQILKKAGAEEPCCPICLEELTDLYRNNKSLRRACTNSLHHRLCSTCYEDIVSHAVGKPWCPLCRAALR